MKRLLLHTIMIVLVLLGFDAAQAQTAQSGDHYDNRTVEYNFFRSISNHKPSRAAFRLMPAGAYSNAAHSRFSLVAAAANPVTGSGTAGRLAKWAGVIGTNTFVLANSSIYEDKFGKVGIGTTDPTSPLTVAGLIETVGAGGGIKFADGTIQTTSATGALFSVPHDATLMGNGTAASPLGVAVPLTLTGAVLDRVLTVQNTQGKGAVIIAGPGAIALSVFGGNDSPSSSGAGWAIDARGGDDSDPGGEGAVAVSALGGSSPGKGGPGVDAVGGTGVNNKGGPGVLAFGGGTFAPSATPGAGVEAKGGTGSNNGAEGVKATGGAGPNQGGPGVEAEGGNGNIGKGGDGLRSVGGTSLNSIGGLGVFAKGGHSDDQTGGHGVRALGGDSDTEIGGHGIIATGGSGPMGNGLAGKFEGDVEISGNLNVTGTTKNFKIDHPLDPENKYLYHAAIESSEALNVYSGNVTTDAKGNAVVTLPEWFDAVNRDLRYQLTVIGTFAQAIVAEKVRNNRFTIKTNAPNVEVSWQVTGVRSDRAMLKHPFKVEENKPERERGYYLHPEAFDQPEERSLQYLSHPENLQQRKEARERAKQKQP